MLPCSKILPGQQQLTPEQEAYARSFAHERMAALLSTAPIDKREAEAHLCAAYRAAGVQPPVTIRWFDSPHSFVQAHAPFYVWSRVKANPEICLGYDVETRLKASVGTDVRTRVSDRVRAGTQGSLWGSVTYSVEGSILASLWANPWTRVWIRLWAYWAADTWTHYVRAEAETDLRAGVPFPVRSILWDTTRSSVRALDQFSLLTTYRFFHEAFEENKLIHLARFNEMVCGYRLGTRQAWVVCKPTFLERDAQGRLHSASGPCIQYRDGWGVYAWHGLRVSKKLIMHPEQVTRKEWMQEPNAERRRAIQERLGAERFFKMAGGKQIGAGRRGKLIEIQLSAHDSERVAHYVQVQDSSTQRHYYLRVPPSITSADEAIAWTFGLNARDYQPGQET